MENRVITISREYGSGGRMIGRKLAEKLGIHCYDAEGIRGRRCLLYVSGGPDTGDDYSG